jgi:hypothetical protein
MYKPNKRHLQPLLISNINDLPEKKRKRLENSWAEDFYRYFFSRIGEDAFAVLYVDYPSRPNVPINWLVGLETLKAGFGWSDEELYDHFCFDLQVRYALGIHDLNESDFDLRTLYYFRQRLSRYNLEHGVNLLTQAFEDITDQQLTTLQVKTGKQRMDSTQVTSNILDMSRLQLLVEAVQRMHRSLSEADQQGYAETFAPYLQGHSGQYVYRIKGQEAKQGHLQQIGEVIVLLLEELREDYAQEPAYQVLKRFFDDNFRLEAQAVRPKANQELQADSLQSVDDLEATYRRKGSQNYKGYVANLSETCDPDNAVQLITKVQVAPNNTNDNTLLLAALPNLKERTGLETLYTDGPYAGPDVDPALQRHRVEQIQTGINGKRLNPDKLYLADFDIEQNEQGVPIRITCPGKEQTGACTQGQSVPVELSSQKSSYRADFDPSVCLTCPFHLAERCPARPGKKRPSFRLRFTPAQMAVAQRRRKMRQSKQTGKNHRAAIEGTIREVKHPFPAGKLPVRGLFRMTCLMVGSAAMTNVRRIHHYWEEKRKDEQRKMAAETGAKAAPEQQGNSLFLLLKDLLTGKRPFMPLSKAYLGC